MDPQAVKRLLEIEEKLKRLELRIAAMEQLGAQTGQGVREVRSS